MESGVVDSALMLRGEQSDRSPLLPCNGDRVSVCPWWEFLFLELARFALSKSPKMINSEFEKLLSLCVLWFGQQLCVIGHTCMLRNVNGDQDKLGLQLLKKVFKCGLQDLFTTVTSLYQLSFMSKYTVPYFVFPVSSLLESWQLY